MNIVKTSTSRVANILKFQIEATELKNKITEFKNTVK